jgi:hypothetical protein
VFVGYFLLFLVDTPEHIMAAPLADTLLLQPGMLYCVVLCLCWLLTLHTTADRVIGSAAHAINVFGLFSVSEGGASCSLMDA